MTGEHAGYCIGGPWNGKQMASLRHVHVLYDLPSLGSIIDTHAPDIVSAIGEYRWRDGSWIWVPEGETLK